MLMVHVTTNLIDTGVIVQNFLRERIARRVKFVDLLFLTKINRSKCEKYLKQLALSRRIL